MVLERAPLELRFRIVATGQVLFCADPDLRTNYEDRVVRDWLDWECELRLYEAEVAATIREIARRG